MLSILERYKWHQFSVVTSQIAGHDDFIQAVRERVADMQDRFKYVETIYCYHISQVLIRLLDSWFNISHIIL